MAQAQDLCAELRSLQELLSGYPSPGGTSRGGAATLQPPLAPRSPPPPPPADGDSSSDDEVPARRIKASPQAHSNSQLLDLERQLAALRQKRAEDADRCRRLQEALEAAQRDGALVGSRLRAELMAKQEESAQLAELVVQLREEADGLRQQVHCTTAAAQRSGQSAQASLEQLQAAASEWRRHGEDSLEALAEEREHCAALRAEVAHLQRQLGEERERARAAGAAAQAAAGLTAAVGGSPRGVVADLRARLSQERAWRKAVCRWLEGEMATRADLERALVNVGTAARTGAAPCGSSCWCGNAAPPPPPPLPPRHMAAGQLAQQHMAASQMGQQHMAASQMGQQHMAASRMAQQQQQQQQQQQPVPHAPSSPAVQVTVHSPPGPSTLMVGVDSTTTSGEGSCGSCGSRHNRTSSSCSLPNHSGGSGDNGGSSSSKNNAAKASHSGRGKGDWREHFKETMKAFDERHTRLQSELSALRREALLQAS